MVITFDEVLREVQQIFREVLNNDGICLAYATTAKEIEQWDSLSHIELVLAIEKRFKMRFNFTELQKFKNVGELCDNVVARLAKEQ